MIRVVVNVTVEDLGARGCAGDHECYGPETQAPILVA